MLSPQNYCVIEQTLGTFQIVAVNGPMNFDEAVNYINFGDRVPHTLATILPLIPHPTRRHL